MVYYFNIDIFYIWWWLQIENKRVLHAQVRNQII